MITKQNLKTDFTEQESKEIWDYYRMSAARVTNTSVRMKLTSMELHDKHPEVSIMSYYKYLSRQLEELNG